MPNAGRLDTGPGYTLERGTVKSTIMYWWQKQGKKVIEGDRAKSSSPTQGNPVFGGEACPVYG